MKVVIAWYLVSKAARCTRQSAFLVLIKLQAERITWILFSDRSWDILCPRIRIVGKIAGAGILWCFVPFGSPVIIAALRLYSILLEWAKLYYLIAQQWTHGLSTVALYPLTHPEFQMDFQQKFPLFKTSFYFARLLNLFQFLVCPLNLEFGSTY